jgi:hypothetical protein
MKRKKGNAAAADMSERNTGEALSLYIAHMAAQS